MLNPIEKHDFWRTLHIRTPKFDSEALTKQVYRSFKKRLKNKIPYKMVELTTQLTTIQMNFWKYKEPYN